jgi:ribonuclease Z
VSDRQFIVLGTASQAPTRHRHHNSYALRWDDQLVLFDPGEGTQRQCILAGVAIARATAVCVTHFHGDHCLGLPGVIQRRALDVGNSGTPPTPLPVFHPAEGSEYLERLRTCTSFHDISGVEARPVDREGPVAVLAPSAHLSARRLDHRVPTIGYRIDEPDGFRLVPEALQARGLRGPVVGRLVRDGKVDTPDGVVTVEEVSVARRGQSMAFVMDTMLCDGAVALAEGVDLLVCESTYLNRDAELALRYRHLTAGQAGVLAREAGAGRLVLTHFSSRYPDAELFRHEASAVHPDVVVAKELEVVAVPRRSQEL